MKQLALLSLVYTLAACIDIKIQNPQSLKSQFENGVIQSSEHVLGQIPWGKSLVGTLHYFEPYDGCIFWDSTVELSKKSILLLDQNNCSYFTKAEYALIHGAEILIIVHSGNGPIDKQEIFNEQTGSALGIPLPVLIIGKDDGEILKSYIKNNQATQENITLSLNFDIVKTNQVKYQVWLSSCDHDSYLFLEHYYKYHMFFNETDINFTPYYFVFKQHSSDDEPKAESNLCINNGQYCQSCSSNNTWEKSEGGKLYLPEVVRQKCLYYISQSAWWKYVISYRKRCMQHHELEQCSKQLVNEIDQSIFINFETCYNKSFRGDSIYTSDNSLLSKELNLMIENGIFFNIPAVKINNVIYEENLFLAKDVYEQICKGFTNAPLACISPLHNHNKLTENSEHHYYYALIAICFLIILCAVFYYFRRIIIRDTSQDMVIQINSSVSKYFLVKDKKSPTKV